MIYRSNFGNFATQTPRDSLGYGPAQAGGVVNVRWGTVVYTQDGVPSHIATLPKGAEIVKWEVRVDTGFDDSGTDLLDIGDDVDDERFADDLNVASAGLLSTGFVAAETLTPLLAETPILATYNGQNGNASEGSAVVFVYFVVR